MQGCNWLGRGGGSLFSPILFGRTALSEPFLPHWHDEAVGSGVQRAGEEEQRGNGGLLLAGLHLLNVAVGIGAVVRQFLLHLVGLPSSLAQRPAEFLLDHPPAIHLDRAQSLLALRIANNEL